MIDKDEAILDIVRRDPRYSPEAYDFVFEALDFTLRRRGDGPKHVSGPEIMESVRQLALEQFGLLARSVLERWGVHRTADFGDIVFNLIDADLLQKTASDRREDFVGLYDFSVAFDSAFDAALMSVDL
ncbi:MAG: Minf_1886 family protein [Planctomycetota bacterium]|jgi:uncharacterized repeat protein (TIGR04138 family)